MASVSSEIGAMIKSLSALEGMAEKCAPEIVLAIRGDLKRTIAAGTTPYGEPWKPTLDGKTPLRNALKAVSVTAVATKFYIVVDGPEALHHLGAARGAIKRRIIPSKKRLPDGMALGIKRALDKFFESEVKHGG